MSYYSKLLKNMSCKLLLAVFASVAFAQDKLSPCAKNASEVSICEIGHTPYWNNAPPEPRPAVITPLLNILEFVDINSDDKTFTIFVELLVTWNDTSIALGGNTSGYVLAW